MFRINIDFFELIALVIFVTPILIMCLLYFGATVIEKIKKALKR